MLRMEERPPPPLKSMSRSPAPAYGPKILLILEALPYDTIGQRGQWTLR